MLVLSGFMRFSKDITDEFAGTRIDKFLVAVLPGASRSSIQKRIESGSVLVNREHVKSRYVLAEGDEVYVKDDPDDVVEAEQIDIPVILEDKHYFVIDKPAGIVVHPSNTGHYSGTVVNAFLDRIADDFEDMTRPGIVHRLDKNTSGLMLLARDQAALEYFVGQFKKKKVKKIYSALVKGILPHKSGVIDSPIGRGNFDRKKMSIMSDGAGKNAVTRFRVVEEFDDVSLLEVRIETGRTHQIRVHMQAIGHPVVGDRIYGERLLNARFKSDFGLERQFLHASELEFCDIFGKTVYVKSMLPEDLAEVLNGLRKTRL